MHSFIITFIAVWSSSLAFSGVDPTRPKDFEVYGVKLTSDSYSVVAGKLGNAKLIYPRSTGAGADGPVSFCYEGKKGVRLTFKQGFSEDHTHITGYRLERSYGKRDVNCRIYPKLNKSLRTPNGLGLGISKSKLDGILGSPGEQTNSSASYSFEKHVEFAKGKGNIVSLQVKASFDQAKTVKVLEVDFGSEPY